MSKIKIFIPILIFLCSFFFYLSIYKEVSITYWDEHDWIGKSYFFELLLKKDFNSELWSNYSGYDQPKLAEYMYGIVLYPTYLNYNNNKKYNDYIEFLIDNNFYKIESSKYEQYKNKNSQFIDWGKNPNEVMYVNASSLRDKFGKNIEKTINLIFKARKINVYILSINIVIVYFLTYILSNSLLISLLTSFFYSSNLLIINSSLRAQSDGLFTLLFNISLLFLILYFKNKNHPTKYAILFAFFSALLNSTKINGVMILIIFYLLLLFYFLKNYFLEKRQYLLKILLNFILSFFIFLNLFILHHPLLIKNPIKNIPLLYEHRINTAIYQTKDFPHSALINNKDRLFTIWDNFLGSSSLYYLNNITLKRIIEKKSSFYLILIRVSFIIGFILFLLQKWQEFWFFIASFFLIQIIMSFYLFLNWDRYSVHLVFFFCFFPLYSLNILKEFFYRLLKFHKLLFPKKKI